MNSNRAQLNLALLGPTAPMIDLPFHEIARCKTPYEALRLCMDNARPRLTESQWAEHVGVTQGHFNLVKNKDRHQNAEQKRHLPPEWIAKIQSVARNRAITQYLEAETNGQLNCQQPEHNLTVEEKAALFDQLTKSA